MKTIQEEKYEYDKFMLGLAHKTQEVQYDFDKLSDENKCKVKNELAKVLVAHGITGVLEHLNKHR